MKLVLKTWKFIWLLHINKESFYWQAGV